MRLVTRDMHSPRAGTSIEYARQCVAMSSRHPDSRAVIVDDLDFATSIRIARDQRDRGYACAVMGQSVRVDGSVLISIYSHADA